jgi:NADH:ubiquinone oxidoreductase subunit F (NADH-binding)
MPAAAAASAALAGTVTHGRASVLLGGLLGRWASLDDVRDQPIDPADKEDDRLGVGCGVVSFARSDTCGVRAIAEIMTFTAGQSAAQCGPCVFGLAAISEATGRLAADAPSQDDLGRIGRWAVQGQGCGACHPTDGAMLRLQDASMARRRAPAPTWVGAAGR